MIVKPRKTYLSCGVTLTEIDSDLDRPERPRDFDIDGGYTVLVRELEADSQEFDCQSYTVMEHCDERGGGLWSVWRELL